jgi:hypothetical protein
LTPPKLSWTEISVLLGRAYPPPLPKANPRKPFSWPSISLNPIIGALALLLLVGALLHLKSVEDAKFPIAAKPVHDLVTASASAMIDAFDRYKEWYDRHPALTAPPPVGGYFNVEMPDGRRLDVIVRAPVGKSVNLPFTGNQINDARYVASEGSWYVWTLPLAGNTATWIDP